MDKSIWHTFSRQFRCQLHGLTNLVTKFYKHDLLNIIYMYDETYQYIMMKLINIDHLQTLIKLINMTCDETRKKRLLYIFTYVHIYMHIVFF